MDIDPVTASWIIRFFIHRSIGARALDSLIRALPLPDDDLDLQKSLLLFKLECDEASRRPVSKSTLHALEQLEEIDFRRGEQASDALRHAFCAVAVDCAMRPLQREDPMEFYSTVKLLWKKRIPMMEKHGAALRSEMLEAWKCDIDAAAWDDDVCRDVLEKFESVRAEEAVRVYVKEERDKLGQTFQHLVAEKVKREDLQKVARVIGIDLPAVEEEEEETPVKKQETPVNSTAARKLLVGSGSAPPSKKRRRNRRWSNEEEDALRAGVAKFGRGYWKLILNDNRGVFEGRTEVDLKDKWRNMTR